MRRRRGKWENQGKNGWSQKSIINKDLTGEDAKDQELWRDKNIFEIKDAQSTVENIIIQ